MVVKAKEIEMFKQLLRSMIAARQASASMQALDYLSDDQLAAIGHSRNSFVAEVNARLQAELDDIIAEKNSIASAPVNENLVGAV